MLFAAALSPDGGSAAAIELLGRGGFVILASGPVLREALGNLRIKGTAEAVARFYVQLGGLPVELVEATEGGREIPSFVAAKDHHVVRACLGSRADVCLTLDRRHLLTDEVRRRALGHGLRLLAPGEFLAWVRLGPGGG